MKSLGRRLIDFLVGHDALWRLMNASLLRVARYAESSRREKVASEVGAREISRLIPDLTVRHGPFRGMRFPDTESTTGCLFPMILGSYERELHPLIERIVATPYTEIVNMGCGEGYYAVGLAMRIPTAMVLGYDIDSAATRLCRRLAEFNGVGSRVVVKDNCDGALFVHQDFRRGGLVVSDREGCELQLFTERSVETLANTDVLIEVHDTLVSCP